MERNEQLRSLYLKVFAEEGISEENLKEAIVQSFQDEGLLCNTFEEIPISEIEEALLECYEAGGMKFETADEILDYYNNKEN